MNGSLPVIRAVRCWAECPLSGLLRPATYPAQQSGRATCGTYDTSSFLLQIVHRYAQGGSNMACGGAPDRLTFAHFDNCAAAYTGFLSQLFTCQILLAISAIIFTRSTTIDLDIRFTSLSNIHFECLYGSIIAIRFECVKCFSKKFQIRIECFF